MKMRFSISKLVSLILLGGCTLTASALSSSYYRSASVLSSGHWVKIKVSESGIQEIPFEKLREWGFSDPSKVTVYGYGGSYLQRDIINTDLVDDLPQQYSIINDDRILFYGESGVNPIIKYDSQYYATPARNFASDEGYYFLTDSRQRETRSEIPFQKNELSSIDKHTCFTVFEEELTNPSATGQHFFGRDLSKTTGMTVEFDIKDLADRSVTISSIWAAIATHNNQTVTMKFYTDQSNNPLTATQTPSIKFNTPDDKSFFTTSPLASSDYSVKPLLSSCTVPEAANQFRVVLTRSSYYNYLANDYIGFRYIRYNRISDESELPMTFTSISNAAPVIIYDANESVQVWDINTSASVRPYKTVYDNGNLTFSFQTTRLVQSYNNRAIAFNPSAKHHEVDYVGIVENQNLHAMKAPDLLIISSDLCYDQALRLAELHRTHLGHKVEVVKQNDIFNEFSSGAPTPVAYRRLATMLYDRNQNRFRNLLLFGGGSYDNRGISDVSGPYVREGALLMTYPVELISLMASRTKSYTTDAYFGFLSDKYTPDALDSNEMVINVGRIPVTDTGKATSAVDKIEHYLTHIPSSDIANRAVIMTDGGNKDLHLLDGEAISKTFNTNLPGSTIIKVYQALYSWKDNTSKDGILARNVLISSLKQGIGYFSYSGHGAQLSITCTSLWDITHVSNTTNDYFPFAMLGTCDTYPFDRLERNIVEEMVLKKDGGMINAIAACRTVYQDRNRVLSLNVTDAYTSADQTTLTGDIYRIGRNNTILNYSSSNSLARDGRLNTLCYNLCGDPALPLYQGKPNVKISTINEQNFSVENKYQLKSYNKNVIEGIIQRDNGEVNTDFNGSIILTLHESPVVKKTISHPIGDASDRDTAGRAIDTDFDVLMQTIAKVENGRFKAEIYPTAISREGEYNRLTFFAYSPDRKQIAKGTTTATYLTLDDAVSAKPADTEAPVISEFYIDAPTFSDGDCVDGEFEINAAIENDVSGISIISSTLGSGCYIMIDENRRIPVYGSMMTFGEDGSTRISVPVDMVTDGRHTASIHVSDNAGNKTTAEISFYVINKSSSAILTVDESPARTEANFTLTHNFPDTPTGRLVIEDNAGNIVRVVGDTESSSNSFNGSYSWDLFDMNDNPVADGIYRARAFVRSGMKFAETPEIEILVLQKQ